MLGAVCILLCCTLAGCTAAERLRREERLIRTLRTFLNAVCNSLRSTLPLISDMLAALAGQAQFSDLIFLQSAAAAAKDGFSPSVWEEAVCADHTLSPELRGILTEVGQILGAMPLAEQLSALALCDERLRALQSDAEQRNRSRGMLVQRLGILGGLFLAILVL
jgi:stage III sporulation protein AB